MLLLWLLTACGLLSDPTLEETEVAARVHFDAIDSAAPAGDEDCDGLERMLAGEDPRGCRARPARSLDEALAVAEACARLAKGRSEDPEQDLWKAAYGTWAATPLPLLSCAETIDKVAIRLHAGIEHVRPDLPTAVEAVRGGRWHAWLRAAAESDRPALRRGWWEVEGALDHCGAIDGERCREMLATRGIEAERVDLSPVLDSLEKAEARLDWLDHLISGGANRPR